jgi:acyl carrier protein
MSDHFGEDSPENRVRKILCDHFGKKENEITPDFNIITGLGLELLDLIELTMALEEEFEILIPDEDAEKWNTVSDIVKYVTNRSQSQ